MLPNFLSQVVSKLLTHTVTLTRTLLENGFVLRKRIQAGASLRIVLVDPDRSEVLDELYRRSQVGDDSARFWRDGIRNSLAIIDSIATSVSEKARVEVRLLPYLPAFQVDLINPDEQDALCYVELYHHRSDEPKAAFTLTGTTDPFWFRYFRNQFETLWLSADPRAQATKANLPSV